MDPQYLLEMANIVVKLKMFPYFEIAHIILVCVSIREDLGGGSYTFSRMHPLASWASCMASVFAGSLVANFLMGEPVVTPFKNNTNVLIATAVWYAIFYAPFDIAYTICKFFPIRLSLAIANEVLRCKKVYDGISHSYRIYPNAILIMIIIGTIKGNGSEFMRIMDRLFRGVWTPNSMALLHPTFTTKASIAASVLFALEKKTDIFTAPHALIYAGVVVFFVYFKLSSMILGIHDPFLPFENLFCFFFMGGIWDIIAKNKETNKEASKESSSKEDGPVKEKSS